MFMLSFRGNWNLPRVNLKPNETSWHQIYKAGWGLILIFSLKDILLLSFICAEWLSSVWMPWGSFETELFINPKMILQNLPTWGTILFESFWTWLVSSVGILQVYWKIIFSFAFTSGWITSTLSLHMSVILWKPLWMLSGFLSWAGGRGNFPKRVQGEVSCTFEEKSASAPLNQTMLFNWLLCFLVRFSRQVKEFCFILRMSHKDLAKNWCHSC